MWKQLPYDLSTTLRIDPRTECILNFQIAYLYHNTHHTHWWLMWCSPALLLETMVKLAPKYFISQNNWIFPSILDAGCLKGNKEGPYVLTDFLRRRRSTHTEIVRWVLYPDLTRTKATKTSLFLLWTASIGEHWEGEKSHCFFGGHWFLGRCSFVSSKYTCTCILLWKKSLLLWGAPSPIKLHLWGALVFWVGAPLGGTSKTRLLRGRALQKNRCSVGGHFSYHHTSLITTSLWSHIHCPLYIHQ